MSLLCIFSFHHNKTYIASQCHRRQSHCIVSRCDRLDVLNGSENIISDNLEYRFESFYCRNFIWPKWSYSAIPRQLTANQINQPDRQPAKHMYNCISNTIATIIRCERWLTLFILICILFILFRPSQFTLPFSLRLVRWFFALLWHLTMLFYLFRSR